MVAVTICSDFGAKENKVCHCFHCFSIYLPWSDGTGCHILGFWMLSFKPAFSLSSFTSRDSSYCSFCAIRVVSSTCQRLLIFLPAILIPISASSSLAFHMMYSAYKLNKPGDNIQPWRTPFPIWRQSVFHAGSTCCFLTCIQACQEAGKVVWYSHFFKNFPQFVVMHTVKGFSIVNKAEVDVFLKFSCFFLWSNRCWQFGLIPLPFLNLVWTSGSSLLRPSLENFQYYFASMWNESSCAVVWAFFTFLWDWNENWPFPVLWPLLSFPNLLVYWIQHFNSII